MDKGELYAAVTKYTRKPTLTDIYDTWLTETQQRIGTQCRLPEQEQRAKVFAAGKYIALPNDFIEARKLDYEGWPLQYRTPEQAQALEKCIEPSGGPGYYSLYDGELQLIPAQPDDSTATLDMIYYAREAPLTVESTTTRVLTKYPYLYLYGMMIEANIFLENDTGLQRYMSLFGNMVAELNDRAARARYSGSTLQMVAR